MSTLTPAGHSESGRYAELTPMMANPRYRIFEERDLMTWRDNGACLDEDPELFFANGNTGPALRQIEEAKAVCRRCEVIDTCLRWAIESRQETGVWGGLSEDERRTLKRRNARDSSLRLSSTAPPWRGSSSVR